MFVVYLTMYTGSKLPKWYIGSSSEEKVKNGYNGSVSSKKYRTIYKEEQSNNKSLFKTRILSKHIGRKEALLEENRVQKIHNVVKNDNYINMSYANYNGFFGMDVSGINNPNYGNIWSQEMKDKSSLIHTGRVVSEETKKKHSKSISGNKHWNYGNTWSVKVKSKISKSSIGKHKNEERDGKSLEEYYGKDKSKNIIEKIKNSSYHKASSYEERFGVKASEIRGKISKATKGRNNGNAKRWKLISPEGIEYSIEGNLVSFCSSMDLPLWTVKKNVNTGFCIYKGRAKGWFIYRLD